MISSGSDLSSASEEEVRRWVAEGRFVKGIDVPAQWMIDAARDPRPPQESYQPLADHLDRHVRGERASC